MNIVLTNCSNRKKGTTTPKLTINSIIPGPVDYVSEQWLSLLKKTSPANHAREVYCGRSYREAEASASILNCPLYVVSAGLGIVNSDHLIPVYNLTTISGTTGSILTKITDDPSSKAWWSRITRENPFGSSLGDILAQYSGGLVLVALPRQYIELLQEELMNLTTKQQKKLRFFGKSSTGLPDSLIENWMPYDDRLDSLGFSFSGTQTDFAQRALRHFVTEILGQHENEDAYIHRSLVLNFLSPITRKKSPKRQRTDDNGIHKAIFENWENGKGQSSKLLRIIRRELGIACEQTRFRNIYYSVKKMMENTP